jgi:hypothetical protein
MARVRDDPDVGRVFKKILNSWAGVRFLLYHPHTDSSNRAHVRAVRLT